MKQLIQASILAVGMALGASCADAPKPTAEPSAKPAAAASNLEAMAGHWTGNANVVVQWANQKQLPVALDIAADGSVTGTVGDATLVDARLRPGRSEIERSLKWGRDYRIHGQLRGDLIAAEQIHRDAVDIVFDQTAPQTVTGGLTSSGWELGGKDSAKLAAGKMVLTRANGK